MKNALALAAVRFPVGSPVHHITGWGGVVTPPAHGPRSAVPTNLLHLPDGGEPVPAGYTDHLAEAGPGVPIVHVTYLLGDGKVHGAWFTPHVLQPDIEWTGPEPTPVPLPVPPVRTRDKRTARARD